MSVEKNELEELLRERLQKGTKDFPPFFKFSNPGEELCGEIINIRERTNKRGETETFYDIMTLDGKKWTLPTYVILARLFREQGVKKGDYVMIRYEGEGKATRGRAPKIFSLGKMSKEEIAGMKQGNRENDGITNFIKSLFAFYDEMNISELEERMKSQGYTGNVRNYIENCGFLKLENDIVKKK